MKAMYHKSHYAEGVFRMTQTIKDDSQTILQTTTTTAMSAVTNNKNKKVFD